MISRQRLCVSTSIHKHYSYSLFSLSFFFLSLSLCGLQALSKKENKGSESPELESTLALTPRTEEKYKLINEEFDHMIKT